MTLILTELVLATLVCATAVNDLNRGAGLLTLGVTLALTLLMGMSCPTRPVVVAASTVLLGCAATVALVMVPEGSFRGVFGAHLPFSLPRVAPPGGVFVHPNLVGLVAMPASLSAMGLALHLGGRWRWWLLAAAYCACIAIITSATAAWSLVAGLAVLLLSLTRVRDQLTLVSLLAVVGVASAGVALNLQNRSFLERIPVWSAAIQHVLAAPLLTPGYGSFGYNSFPSIQGNLTAHSLLLQLLVDSGPIGLSAVIAALFVSFRHAKRLAPVPGRTMAFLYGTFLAEAVALLVAGGAESVIETTMPHDAGYLTLVSPIPFFVLALPMPPVSLVALWRKIQHPRRNVTRSDSVSGH